MAKIKQVKMMLELDPKSPYLETTVAINYNSTDRRTETYHRPVPPNNERFFIKLPQVVADSLGVAQAKAGSQDEVVVKFKELIEQHKHLLTEVNQVILYTIEVAPKPGEKMSLFGNGRLLIIVWAGTYEETVATAGDGTKRYSYARVESPVNFAETDEFDRCNPTGGDADRFDKQVPWTEQNATFFLWIKDNMTLLIERLHDLEQPNNLVEAIQAGRLLPLGDR